MKSRHALWGTGVLIVLGVLAAASSRADNVGSTRIVGGISASQSEFPSIVSLQANIYGGHFCGGTLIRKDWVLTAAHCLADFGTLSKLRVVVGLQTQGVLTNTRTYSATKALIHPQYSQKSDSDFDFALIKLNGTSTAKTTKLNTVELEIPFDEASAPLATAAGWGALKEGGDISKKLMKVDLPLVNESRCAQAYPGKITDTMLCAGRAKGGKDSCQGDSGGPLFVRNKLGERILAGVVSWGYGCARPNQYGVYSKVSAGVSWITKILAQP